jgi:hypothetical protein
MGTYAPKKDPNPESHAQAAVEYFTQSAPRIGRWPHFIENRSVNNNKSHAICGKYKI